MSKKHKMQNTVLKVSGMMVAIVFAPTTIMFLIGMLPTVVAAFVNRHRIRILTVGALNFAGCVPFVYQLWLTGHSFDNAIILLAKPENIIVMYVAAAVGYLIDWAVTGVVAAMMYEKARARKKEIKARLEVLVERWGQKVTGAMQLDAYGFPLDGYVKLVIG